MVARSNLLLEEIQRQIYDTCVLLLFFHLRFILHMIVKIYGHLEIKKKTHRYFHFFFNFLGSSTWHFSQPS